MSPQLITPVARAGLSIPDYELLRPIGRGAYGEVWLARNVTGSWVALKIVHRAAFDHDRPFEREFEGIKRFEPISRSDPSQVAILHVGLGDGFFYYVMELADPVSPDAGCSIPDTGSADSGRGIQHPASRIQNPESYAPLTLKRLLNDRGALPAQECLAIALSLTRALAHLHGHGLVHRDVKPSNVIFVNGQAKLADIGLVTSVDATRSFVGTEGYLPPEGAGTPQADLYSLGKVLYEMSTGCDRKEFPALPPDIATRPDRDALAELNAIVVRACQLNPRERYKNAEEMHADLALLQRGQSVKAKRVTQRRLAVAKKFLVATTAVALLATGAWLLANRFNASTSQRFNGAAEVNSIAVLAFGNESLQPARGYLRGALAEETLNALTNCAGLRVASRSAVFAFRGAANDVRQIGAQLGVRILLAGTFLRDSNSIHVTASLLNVADGAQIWSASFDRGQKDFGALGADVIRQGAQALGFTLEVGVLDRARTNLMRKMGAYQLYAEAQAVPWNTMDGNNNATEVLNRAIAEDPNFGEAHATLALCYSEATGFLLPPAQAMTAARASALRAIQLDDTLVYAHLALGAVFLHHELNFTNAMAEYRRAIEVAPHLGGNYGYYARGLSYSGDFTTADEVLKQGEQVDPKAHNLHGAWCRRYYLERRFDDMLRQVARLQALYPKSVMGFLFLAQAQERLENYPEALAAAQQLMDADPAPDAVALLGLVHARMGHRDEAQQALEELRVLSQSRRASPLYSAQVLLALGQRDQAIEHLQRAVAEYPPTVLDLKTDPFWDGLRSDAGFIEVLKKVK